MIWLAGDWENFTLLKGRPSRVVCALSGLVLCWMQAELRLRDFRLQVESFPCHHRAAGTAIDFELRLEHTHAFL